MLEAGCETCACAAGFSYSSECNRETGACSCKPNFHGPKCDVIGDGFYCARIDHIVYEAEEAFETSNFSQISEKYDLESGHDDDFDDNDIEKRKRSWVRWTGIGFMRVFETSHLKFRLMHAYTTGIFDLLIRYDSHENWENILIKVVNIGPENFKSKKKSLPVKSCSVLRPGQKKVEQNGARFYRRKI